jgi:argininosuccinate synthase
VSLDGKLMPMHELVIALNAKVGPTGWGRLDMVENRRVGIKSRECYEAPGALALFAARAELESICLERDLAATRRDLGPRYAQLTYDGLWFGALRESLDAFFASCDQVLDGEVRLALEPGRCYANGRRAPRGLYDYELATYEAEDSFRHTDSAGFVRLWGLATQVWSMKQGPASRGRNQ